MTTKRYALGMGDTDFLNDGVYETLNEVHTEALRLKDLKHDNGDYHTSYMIGEVVSSSSIAVESSKVLIDSLVEFIGDEVDELEDFNGVFDNFITIDEEGKSKLEVVLKDVLLNHTKYPKDEVITNLKSFLVEDNIQTIKCPYCQADKEVVPSEAQTNGLSRYKSAECNDCKGTFHTFYNRDNGCLAAEPIKSHIKSLADK